jgi:beta-phosphoglucomutase-like phosphatase (HAD superfamily)
VEVGWGQPAQARGLHRPGDDRHRHDVRHREGGDAGVPSALVTMSWRSLADAVLAALPDDTFSAVITGDEVEHGKPHPEPYLAAARALGVEVGDCVAIEDSPTGVRSAVAAGVPTIAVPHVVPVPVTVGAVQLPSLRGITPADLRTVFDGTRQ